MLLCAVFTMAQVNLQLHGDFGRLLYPENEPNRQIITTTVEFFKADRLGSTFFFIDMDYRGQQHNGLFDYEHGEANRGIVSAYWEIGRDFTFATVKETNHSFTAHVEYDGGLGYNAGVNAATPFQQAVLAGPTWQWHSNDFSKTTTLQVMYKHMLPTGPNGEGNHPSFQITGVWGVRFADDWCTFSGFADLWYAQTPKGAYTKPEFKDQLGLVFLTEPQFWVNVLNRHQQNNVLSVGIELEISNNFIWYNMGQKNPTFYCNPTIALKYAF